MTPEEFQIQVQDLALYLIGKKDAAALPNNRFLSKRTGKINLDDALRSLFEEDRNIVEAAINQEIQRNFDELRYDGKTATEVKAELAKKEEVLILTHQIEGLQDSPLRENLGAPIWLVGGESSPPLSAEALERAGLVHHSVGGDFDFSLSSAKVVRIGGGALDQCLVQTIHSVSQRTTQKEVTVEIMEPLTYIDLIGGTHMSVADFRTHPPSNAKETSERFREELVAMLEMEGFKPGKPEKGRILPDLTFKNTKGRTLTIRFRPT